MSGERAGSYAQGVWLFLVKTNIKRYHIHLNKLFMKRIIQESYYFIIIIIVYPIVPLLLSHHRFYPNSYAQTRLPV